MRYFTTYQTQARAQIFAISVDSKEGAPARDLELVTTVGTNHLGLVPDLLNRLNQFMQYQAHPDEDLAVRAPLEPPDLEMFPTPVADSIRRYLETRCATPLYGEWGWRGPIYSVPDYVDRLRRPRTADDLLEFMHGPDHDEVELPVRLENVTVDSERYWALDGRTAAPDVGYDDSAPSRWRRPDGVSAEMIWTSWVVGELDENRNPMKRSLQEGVRLAVAASDAGKRVRIHPVTVWVQNLERDEDGYSTGAAGTSSWIVEVLDAPISDYSFDEEDANE